MRTSRDERTTTIAPGIRKVFRRGKFVGFRARAWVQDRSRPEGGRLVSKRFKKDSDLRTMKEWQFDERRIAKLTPQKHPEPTEGFAADAKTYLAAVKAMPSYKGRTRDIAFWAEVFRDTPREHITSPMIAAQLAAWSTEKTKDTPAKHKFAPATINKRRTALMHLWTVLDGKSAANPVKATPKLREPDPMPRSIPYTIIRQILAAMPRSKTKARVAVMAWTGFPNASVARLTPEDVHLEERYVVVAGRRKGHGTKTRVHPLTEDGVKALQEFARLKAWGPFSRHSLRRSFRTACRKVEVAARKKKQKLDLSWMRPYDVRHSYLSAVYQATGDIRATQALAGHATLAMTERYTLSAVDPRVAIAMTQFEQATTRRRGGPLGGPVSPRQMTGRDRTATRRRALKTGRKRGAPGQN